MTDQYNVNRILDYYTSEFSVEVVCGIDSGNPGRLGIRFRDEGEGENYTDPRCAAIAAVRIQRAWFKSQGKVVETRGALTQGPVHPIGLVHNGRFAGEMGVPGEECSVRELFMWARKEWLGLPKCARCGELVGRDEFRVIDWDEIFCSEYCAEETWNKNQEEVA